MAQLLDARCPGCRTAVRLPESWVGKAVRCKRCQATLRVRPKSKPSRKLETTQPMAFALADEPSAALAVEDSGEELAPLAVDAAQFAHLQAKKEPKDPPLAAAVDEGDPFANLEADVAPMVRPRPQRKRTLLPLLFACLLLVGAGAAGAVVLLKSAFPPESTEVVSTEPEPPTTPSDIKTVDPPKYAGIYPRRMLAVSVNNYLFANPVSFGVEVTDFAAFAKEVGNAFKIPSDQVVVVSDSAGKSKSVPPMKPILEHTISQFLETSRSQDRIILLLCCHAVEVEGEPYLVPFEGDIEAKESLIPARWLMDQLGKCKARQKLLIADICPQDRSRGEERPGSGPMGDALDALLAKPPDGVQVWTSCIKQQQSQEGIFLDEIYEAVRKKKKSRKPIDLGTQKPEDPLPIATLVAEVAKRTEFEVKRLYNETKQTPRLTGKEKEGGAEYDPTVPPAARVEPTHPTLAGGVAPADFVRAMIEQIDTPPTKKVGSGMQALTANMLPWFPAQIAKDYADEAANTPLRESVVKAIKALRKYRPDDSFRSEFRAPRNLDQAKKEIEAEQKKAAGVQLKLADVLLEMEKAGEDLENEKSKRWRVLYQFVLAKMQQRVAYLIEYNYLLGLIRGDALPQRDPEKYSGWRLASREKLQVAGSASSEGKEARKHAKDAKELFQTIMKENPDTPYAILAKRERTTALGLEWQLMR